MSEHDADNGANATSPLYAEMHEIIGEALADLERAGGTHELIEKIYLDLVHRGREALVRHGVVSFLWTEDAAHNADAIERHMRLLPIETNRVSRLLSDTARAMQKFLLPAMVTVGPVLGLCCAPGSDICARVLGL